MADIRFVLPDSDAVTIPGQTVDKLIRAGDGGAALIYLYAFRKGVPPSVSQAARLFERSEKDITASMELLKKLGLLKYDDTAAPPPIQSEELPEYTAADIKREYDNGTVFKALVQEVEKSLGKILTSDDLMRLFGIYDHLGLPPEVILHLVTYCIHESGRKYGSGSDGQKRMPTMRYIEKAAFTWEREGLVTLELAECYLKQLDERRSQLSEIKKVLQIRDRELTDSQQKYIEGWVALGFSPEAIELAYDKTQINTGRLAWPYMDSIINSWHQKKLYLPEDIIAKDGKGSQPNKKKPYADTSRSAAPSPTEIERMKKFLEKLREE
jgi:DNA replication protein DnaD